MKGIHRQELRRCRPLQKPLTHPSHSPGCCSSLWHPPCFLFLALCSPFPHYLSFSLTYLSLSLLFAFSLSGQISLLSLLHCLYWLPSEVNGFLKHLDRNPECLSHLAPPLAFLPSISLLFLLFHSLISLIIDPLGLRSFQSSNAGPPGHFNLKSGQPADRDVVWLD